MAKTTTFTTTEASGAGKVTYPWSDPNNWDNGLPADGDTVYAGDTAVSRQSDADIGPLFLASLTLATDGFFDFDRSIEIGSLQTADGGFQPQFETTTDGTRAVVDAVGNANRMQFYALGGTLSVSTSYAEDYTVYSGATIELFQQPRGTLTFYDSYGANPAPATLILHSVAPGTRLAARTVFFANTVNDTVELPGTTLTALSVSGTDIKITTDATSLEFANVEYQFAKAPTAYTAQVDPATGLLAVTFTACYAEGTRIATDRGERAIEDLAVGDLVVTVSGACRPVRWVGRRRYAGRALAGRRHLLPIRFAPGSLGEGLPRRELVVSPLHAMLIDGVLVPAHLLVNGVSITQDFACRSVHYLHIELDTHDAVWAEGVASETFLDDDSRWVFENAREQGTVGTARACELPLFCAPRVVDGPVLAAIRRRLEGRCRTAVAV